MGTLRLYGGDLLEATERYLCHQTNCVTNRAAHLAKSVFDRFPYANIYQERTPNWVPPVGMQLGDIVIRGNGKDQRYVINMLGQFYPGAPRFPDSVRDGFLARQKAFQACLDKVALISDLDSVAFPFGCGCGAAGGSWIVYRGMIKAFADKVDAAVRVYQI